MTPKILLMGTAIALSMNVQAQNPIVQTCFTTDPAPMVSNGRVYVYTGHDEDKADFFWMQEWRIYSSDDMVNWRDEGTPLAIEDFSWGDDRAWAAQCIEVGGKFYWYVCLHSKLSGGMAIGVAVADSPTGPFRDALGKPLYDDGKWDNIDPTILIDSKGTPHLYWGNPRLHHAVLGKDMVSIVSHEMVLQDAKSFGQGKPSKQEPGKFYGSSYTEGPWAMQRGKNFYMIYAAGGVPEHIAYSMAKSPSGPWTYKGIIMPQGGTDSFTNHVGLIDYEGHSYFFYHTGWAPGGGGFGRSVSVEEFKYNADGTIPRILPHREGVKPLRSFNPYTKVEAETMAYSHGVRTDQNNREGVYVSDTHNGDWVKLQQVDFGDATTPQHLTVSAASSLRGGTLELHTDSIGGPMVAQLQVTHTGSWETWKTFDTPFIKPTTGTHDLYLVFKGRKGPRLFNLDWWKVER
jgi:hypothetical protein